MVRAEVRVFDDERPTAETKTYYLEPKQEKKHYMDEDTPYDTPVVTDYMFEFIYTRIERP